MTVHNNSCSWAKNPQRKLNTVDKWVKHRCLTSESVCLSANECPVVLLSFDLGHLAACFFNLQLSVETYWHLGTDHGFVLVFFQWKICDQNNKMASFTICPEATIISKLSLCVDFLPKMFWGWKTDSTELYLTVLGLGSCSALLHWVKYPLLGEGAVSIFW